MSDEKAVQVTALLADVSRGNRTKIDALMPLVYDELRAMAHRRLVGERSGHTLNTTALVHEAYAKLVAQEKADWQNRVHFFAIAAMAMRRILVNYARTRMAQKRGGGAAVATFDEALMGSREPRPDYLVALDEALVQLAAINERHCKVVECRFFGGLTQEETAEALGVSVDTVRRDWRIARAWLTRALSNASDE